MVDDIEIDRIIPGNILSNLGATCDTACNGQEAVEKYDLILMDLKMPVPDHRLEQLEKLGIGGADHAG